MASSELFRRGLWWARTHPREEIVLAAKKTYYFWNRTESPTNLGIDFAREFSKVLRALPIHFGIVAPLGLAGILFTRRRWRELMPLYAAIAVPWLTCVLFFMSAEYRLPAAAILILFGGHALTRAATAEFTRRRTPVPGRRREGAIALALLLLFALGCNLRSPLLVAQTKNRVAFYDFGVLFERGGDLGRAEAMLRRSLAIDPRFPPALVALAGIEARRGQAAEASQHLQTARSVDPASAPIATDDQPRVEAEGLYQSAQFEAARAAFERAMVHYRRLGRDDDARAMQNNLALTLHRLGRDPDAERILRGLVVDAPDYPKAHSNLALVLESQGRITDAIGEYRRTLELEPTNVRAQRALARLAVH